MGGEFSDDDAVSGRDLFGFPVLPARGPGRPGHVPTAETRAFVNMMLVCGHEPVTVAKLLGLKKSAFYGHYKAELAERNFAALKFKGHQLLRLNREAEGGNVAAEKALAAMVEREQVKQVSNRLQAVQAKPEAKAAPVGKKEAALVKAKEVAGKFAPPPPPPMLLN